MSWPRWWASSCSCALAPHLTLGPKPRTSFPSAVTVLCVFLPMGSSGGRRRERPAGKEGSLPGPPRPGHSWGGGRGTGPQRRAPLLSRACLFWGLVSGAQQHAPAQLSEGCLG